MTLKSLLFLCVLTLLTSCYGQTTDKKSDAHQREETLVKGDTVATLGSSAMLVYQDKKNVYWFGSWNNGVYRYDGETLINYTTEHGLANNRIDEIKEDHAGNLYFTGCHPTSTVSRFDGSSFTTLSPVPSDDWQLKPNDMWFKHAYRNEKVYRYDGTTLYELPLPKPPKLSNPYEVYSIYKDQKRNVWFGTNPVGVCRYDGKSFDWITEEDVTEFRDEGANGVRSVAEDKNGDFWFNTEFRYSVYDSATVNSNQFYTRHESIGGLDGKKDSGLDEYLSTVIDNNDDLWFVTYLDGVWKYDGTKVTHYPIQKDGKNIELFTIYKDNHGDLWLGTHKNGAYKFNGESFEQFVPFK